MSWHSAPVNGWMISMLSGRNLRFYMPCMALLAALGPWSVQAADYEEMQAPLRREDVAHYRPPAHDRLVFKAPRSQLFETWRCNWPVAGANPWAVVPCSPYERTDINPYPGYSSDYLQDPFAPLRFMTQPIPLRPPRPRGDSVPGAPPSQLPNGRTLPLDADNPFPPLLRSTP